MGQLKRTHPWLTGLSSPLTSSVLLKVASLLLSSDHGGRGVGVSLQKKCLDVSCGEKDLSFVYNIDQISAYTRSTDESTVRAKVSFRTMVFAKKKNG